MKTRYQLTKTLLREENKKWPNALAQVPRSKWPVHSDSSSLGEVFRSSGFIVQVYYEDPCSIRLSVCRTTLKKDGSYQDKITWDELMRLKAEAGLAGQWAVELYPPDDEVVNCANMRHLWVIPNPPPFAWVNAANQQPTNK